MRNRARRHPPVPAAGDPGLAPESTSASSFASADVGAVVAGYRVLRRLGASERADVYLGVPTAPVRGAAEAGTRPPVALKIFRRETAGAVIEREFRVLTESTGKRFAALIDLATLSDGRVCIVQEHLSGRRLSRLLSDGRFLAPGEAVTILAPILAALADLLALGYVHEGLAQSSVIFDRTGRPVLTGLGRLRELPPPGPELRSSLKEAALRVSAFAWGVLDRVDPGGDTAVPEPAGWLESIPPGFPLHRLLDELERRLFAWSPASAVSSAASPWVPSSGRRSEREAGWAATEALRLSRAAADPAGDLQPGTGERREPGPAGISGRARAMFGRLDSLLRGLTGRQSDARDWQRLRHRLRHRLFVGLRAHRGPLLVSSLVAAAGAVLLLTLGYQPEARGGSAGPASGARSPVTVGAAPSSVFPQPASPAPTAEPGDLAADRAAVEGDEPVQALRVLLRLRAGCLRAASVACLDGVDQTGSAAQASDGQAARSSDQGDAAAPAVEAGESAPSLVERRGDIALVAVVLTEASAQGNSKPASVLVVKGEAGWRIRQIFDY